MSLPVTKSHRLIDQVASGAFSDFTITCKAHTFKVHKVVLDAAGSSYFNAVLKQPFNENLTSTLNLDDHHPAIIARIIIWLYERKFEISLENYDFCKSLKQDPEPNFNDEVLGWGNDSILTLLSHCQLITTMYATAGYLDLSEIQMELVIDFRKNWDDALNHDIRSRGKEIEHEFHELVRLVWESTPDTARGLKDIIIEQLLEWRESRDPSHRVWECYELGYFARTVQAVPEIAIDLVLCGLRNESVVCKVCGRHGGKRSRLMRPTLRYFMSEYGNECSCPESWPVDVACGDCGSLQRQD